MNFHEVDEAWFAGTSPQNSPGSDRQVGKISALVVSADSRWAPEFPILQQARIAQDCLALRGEQTAN